MGQQSYTQQIYHHSDDKMELTTILLIFLMAFINAVFQISLLVIFIRRIKQIFKIRKLPLYYLVILIYIVGKLIVLGMLNYQILKGVSNDFVDVRSETLQKYVKYSIIIADFALVEMFLFSFEAYMLLCYKILQMKVKQQTIQKFRKLFKFCTRFTGVCILIIQSMILILFITDMFNYNVVNTINAGFNALSVVTFLVSFFYLNFNMTGIMIDTQMNEVMKKIYGIVLGLLLSRFIMTGFQTAILIQIKDGNFMGFIGTFQQNQGQYIIYGLIFICYFVFILITEGIPLMMSLRANTIRAFNNELKQQQDQNRKQSIITSNSDINQSLLDNPTDFDNKDEMELIVEFKSFKIIQMLPSKTTMWNTMKASIGERIYILRQIKGQISSYVIEDIMNEIQQVRQLNIKPLNKVNFFTEQGSIYLYQRCRPIDFDQIIERSKNLVDRLKLALKIAIAIEKFHMKQVAHGCLKPSNIHFDLTDNVYFLGYGLLTLKKYFSLTTDYTNKSFCTAVQVLKDRNKIILNQKKSADIYSFGMILYEIITKNKDYRQMQLEQVKKKFAQERFRPKIPDDVQGNIKNLMRKCWEEEPSDRPYIGYIIDVLRRLLP